jgi:SpoVK/Ycf46/Vps4 family AAA+-type ATPase
MSTNNLPLPALRQGGSNKFIVRRTGMSNLRPAVDAATDFIQDNIDWISKELNVSSITDLHRINAFDWIYNFSNLVLDKKTFTEGLVQFGPLNAAAKEIIKDLDIEKTKVSDNTYCNHFYFGRLMHSNKGSYFLNSSRYMISVRLSVFDFNFIIYSVSTMDGPDTTTFSEILIKKENISKFIEYVDKVENTVKRVTIYVVGQKPINVKPIGWDDVILDDSAIFMIKNDLESFLKKKEWFAERSLPYRRGYLFYGPPGNGKSSAIKAMISQTRIPAYTIKRLYEENSLYYFEEMFELAAQSERSFIVLEDLDRYFTTKGDLNKDSMNSRIPLSVFLNNLDGLSEADGIIVVATANNPAVLDSAILQRPGRFDRVVGFPNPNSDLRYRYFAKFAPECTGGRMNTLVAKCEGMSFAQLREIYILATQLADSELRPINVEDMITSADQVITYFKKAAKNETAGFKK